MTRPINIARAFAEVARANAEFPALWTEDALLSYDQLWGVTRSFALRMQGLGVDRTAISAINTADPIASLGLMLASSLLGAGFVVASKILAESRTVRPTHFFRTAEAAGSSRVSFHLVDESWMPTAADPAAYDLSAFGDLPDPDAPWMYLHTSGTTGMPKYLGLSQRIVMDRTAAVAGDFPYQQTTIAMLFSCVSRPYFARAIGALLNAGTIVQGSSLDFWLSAGVTYVCGSPMQAAHFCRGQSPRRRIARIETSGGRLSDEDARVLLGCFREVVDIYGASETNKTFANVIEEGPDGALRRIGRPLDSTVEIRAEDGHLCGPGELGMVRVRNGYLAPGYIGAPDKTAEAFRDGWFHSGDWAKWGENGELDVIGRKDDVLSIGGVKLYARLMDLVVAVVPGVEDAVCVRNPKAGAGDELVIFVKYQSLVDRSEVSEAIRQAINARFSVAVKVGNIHAIDAVPRDEHGAAMRAVCQAMILAKTAARAEGAA